MTSSPIDRLLGAINAHDIDVLSSCFASTYAVTFPANPDRSFTGRDQVRRNWEALFERYPHIQATATPWVHNGDEIWAEWEFRSDSGERPQFWQRGVIIAVVHRNVIASARFYMEPVTAPGS